MKFIKPSLEYLESYLESLKESEEEGFPEIISSQEIEENREKYIENTKKLETTKCIEILSWLVPSQVFWLVNEKNKEFIGRVSIRFTLGNEFLKSFGGNIGYIVNKKYRKKGYATKLLKFGLEVAKENELAEILITCNEDNIGSKKTIENCGGIFINSLYDSEKSQKNKLRYRIILNDSAQNLWRSFLENNDEKLVQKNEFDYTCWQFGGKPDELAELVLENIKRATTSLYHLYEKENFRLPKAGDYSVVLNSKDEAVCIIKTISTDMKRFKDVDEEFAFKEGEGDKTLSYWQRVHKEFFSNYEENFDENMEVFLEEFEVVYPIKKIKKKMLEKK